MTSKLRVTFQASCVSVVGDTSGSCESNRISAEILHKEYVAVLCMPLCSAETVQAKLVDNCN